MTLLFRLASCSIQECGNKAQKGYNNILTEKVYSGEGEGLFVDFDDSTKPTFVFLFVVVNELVYKVFLQNIDQFGNPFYFMIC